MPHPLIELAREALKTHLQGGSFTPESPPGPPQGCFVSLKIGKKLRGCMGTLSPVKKSLEEEVVGNAIASATRDPRFDPVSLAEFESLRISIDLLSPLEPVESIKELDPSRFGLVVRAGGKAGTLLPSLPGVKTPQQQIAICREKADIGPREKIEMERFTVERLEE